MSAPEWYLQNLREKRGYVEILERIVAIHEESASLASAAIDLMGGRKTVAIGEPNFQEIKELQSKIYKLSFQGAALANRAFYLEEQRLQMLRHHMKRHGIDSIPDDWAKV